MALQSIPIPLTNLNPNSEKQLRMFKRTVGTAQDPTRVSLPREAGPVEISLSKETTSCNGAKKLAESHGGRLATAFEFIMDFPGSIEEYSGKSIFVDWKNTALLGGGFYQIDRKAKRLKPVHTTIALTLPWYERLYITNNAIEASRKKRTLVLDINNHPRFTSALQLDYGADIDRDCQVAIAKEVSQ